MRLINHILLVVRSVYGSADPNLFGSQKRIKEKQGLANEFKTMADSTQNEINSLKTQNPFESAAAKLAMKKASMGARQMQTRTLNMLGANATPEAIIAAQGQTAQSLGAAAGNIAAGAEANKNNQINSLNSLQQAQMGSYANAKTDSINERGSGWRDFFSSLDSIGNLASGAGEGLGSIATAGLI